jgi:predicted alpha/beta hydrolase
MPDNAHPFVLAARDGYPLAATHWSPSTPSRAQLLVLGATGVPQGFYRAVAAHAAAQGCDVLTFDYRGIGGSKPETLRGFPATYDDWARLDAAAALDALREPGKPLWVVGHSFAGHAMGLMADGGNASAMYTFGSGAGWSGWMPPAERRRVWWLWNVIGPPAVALLGCLPMKRLGLGGEDLPAGVYRQWRHWCGFPRYFFDDPQANVNGRLDGFAKARYPIAAANALDDLWALPASRDAFFSGYTATTVEAIDLDPREHGALGHMGYFRRGRERLWDDALAWLDRHGATPPPMTA